MMITKKGFYALTAVLELGKMQQESSDPKAVFQTRSIAQAHSMSEPYLEQIFRRLKNSKIIDAKRGPHGGYRITKPLSEIFVIDIMKAVDENTKFTICSDCGASKRTTLIDSEQKPRCVTHIVWKEMTKIVNDYLSSTNLEALIHRNKSLCQPEKSSPEQSTIE